MKTIQYILAIFILASMTGVTACSQVDAKRTVKIAPYIPNTNSAQEWPPAGMIAFSKTKGGNGDDLYLIHSDGTGLMLLANGPDPWNEHPSWSPDGSRIAYHAGDSAYRTDNVWTIKPDGSGQMQLLHIPKGSRWPAWSPDGTRIVFATYIPDSSPIKIQGTFKIQLINADGSNMRTLTDGMTTDIFPSWAPDGSILFIRKGHGQSALRGDVYAMKPDGSGITQLTTSGHVGGYALSPDGTKLAFYDTVKHQYIVTPIKASGASLTLVDMVDYYNGFAGCTWMALAWSPDGQALALACSDIYAHNGSSLYIVKADGSRLTKIPNTEGAFDPAWQPE